MNFRMCLVLGLCLAVPTAVFADFQYTETTKITGGSIVEMMKVAGVFSKQARQIGDPVTSTVLLKGNRLAQITKDTAQIIDLDKETFTTIDHVHKRYSVMTFEQLKKQIEDAAKQMQKRSGKEEPPEMRFSVNVRNTGASRQISGLPAKESILTMTMAAKDKESGQTGNLAITNDLWLTDEIRGYAEVREFYRKWALKMGTVFAGGMNSSIAAMQPGAGKGMAEMVKEMSKLQGVPVLQVMRMGSTADGKPLPAASEAPLPKSDAPPPPTAGEVAEEGIASGIKSKLGGLGSLGGFGRKKKKEEPKPQPEQPKQAGQTGAAAVLMESHTEMTSFSSVPVDASRFEVPSGYKQVETK